MRSRYCAFAQGEVQYLVDTQHPETREPDLFQSLDMYTKSAQFLELKILDSSENTVEFIATVIHEENIFEQHENSLFEKIAERWYYKEALN